MFLARVIVMATILLSRSKHVISQYCPTGTCYAGSFSSKEHVTKGRYLWGASYRNLSSVAGPQACHSACVGDCRCRAFQMSGKRCELLDEDKDSVPISRFLSDNSYEYFDLQQNIVKSSHLSPCSNGCCMSNPCKNGATCVELCDHPKEKFSCVCTPSCSGKTCERCNLTSCRDHLVYLRQLGLEMFDGVSQIQTNDGQSFPLFCWLKGQTIWTLLESFALKHTLEFKKLSFLLSARSDDIAFNESSPNWEKYRLSQARMHHVYINATKFRATCAYDQKTTIPGWPRDQMIARLTNYDIMTRKRWGECLRMESIFIRNQSCSNCTVGILHWPNHYHAHVNFDSDENCFFNPVNSVQNELAFAVYGNVNPESTCCSSPDATTQWWLGHEAGYVPYHHP
ncbi:uncharacterized protein LOC5516882 [Nematostella vectensis]|uniref:uncharacterized protein LOC5516882 n=1 Tax=Nematostella vectensis TaxID=45351 RepID=UPI0020778542|nr:uncharacterized protein LOC5516882 [Nematostella vectensis]